MSTGAATLENGMEVPQKAKNRTTIWSRNCTAKYLYKEYKNTDVYSSIIYDSKIVEAAQVSMFWWMDEEVAYMYNGILLSHKKEWHPAIGDDMDG